MSELLEHIRTLAENGLENESLFVVDVSISEGKTQKVVVLLDGDEGITIEECSKVSRYIGNALEEDLSFDLPYTLDVGSPGLDNPLKLTRQYHKNVGRKLKVRRIDGEVVEGNLTGVVEESIQLETAKKGSKESLTITFDDIDWAKVQVSF